MKHDAQGLHDALVDVVRSKTASNASLFPSRPSTVMSNMRALTPLPHAFGMKLEGAKDPGPRSQSSLGPY